MNIVLWFLKNNLTYFGEEGNPIIMKAITSDLCPIGYKGVRIFVSEEALENGLTEDVLMEIGGEG